MNAILVAIAVVPFVAAFVTCLSRSPVRGCSRSRSGIAVFVLGLTLVPSAASHS